MINNNENIIIVQCPECESKYRVDKKLLVKPKTVRCINCSYVWLYKNNEIHQDIIETQELNNEIENYNLISERSYQQSPFGDFDYENESQIINQGEKGVTELDKEDNKNDTEERGEDKDNRFIENQKNQRNKNLEQENENEEEDQNENEDSEVIEDDNQEEENNKNDKSNKKQKVDIFQSLFDELDQLKIKTTKLDIEEEEEDNKKIEQDQYEEVDQSDEWYNDEDQKEEEEEEEGEEYEEEESEENEEEGEEYEEEEGEEYEEEEGEKYEEEEEGEEYEEEESEENEEEEKEIIDTKASKINKKNATRDLINKDNEYIENNEETKDENNENELQEKENIPRSILKKIFNIFSFTVLVLALIIGILFSTINFSEKLPSKFKTIFNLFGAQNIDNLIISDLKPIVKKYENYNNLNIIITLINNGDEVANLHYIDLVVYDIDENPHKYKINLDKKDIKKKSYKKIYYKISGLKFKPKIIEARIGNKNINYKNK